MDRVDRRKFLGMSAAAAGAALIPAAAKAADTVGNYDQAYAILYDATRCIGCRACARKCREKQNLPPVPEEIDGVKFDMPTELSPNDYMVLQAYQRNPAPTNGEPSWSFLKRNCMHCNVPACVSACPVAALQKTDEGPVVYLEDRCIGCRYCMLACPYTVPRYEWRDRMPRVCKCDLNGACVNVCPTGALIDGTRRELIDGAHRRIKAEPNRYVDHVYGEHEAGGASYLILAGIPFEEYGLPDLPDSVRSSYANALMGGLPGWIIGMGLLLGGIYKMQQHQESRHTGQSGHNVENEQ